ncbi:MAG: DMT family transporter [Rhodobacteraceae bacterium]|jgi:S-adenosylmethionine uptake transporter|uniref:DMT family transporter n=1 Tax=Albidovulum sp. TaxID=1872424 RepID=UPI001DCF23D4|nr:DMT family transporter [uncultured Defluviimonas sp.]MCB2125935.1 DMT family transporter [Paracoccaceae bacterium]MCC0071429.1 DMT family transporter [Paracoccaceae bacterium]
MTPATAHHNFRGAIFALLAMGIFATHDAVVKHLGAAYSPFQIVFFASLLSFPPVAVIMLNDTREASLRPRHPGWVLFRTVLTVVTGVSAFYAFSTLPLAQVYVILFASPLLITILAIPLLGEKVRARRWAAVIVGLLGVIIVMRPGQAELSLGHLAALTAAVCGATASVIVRKIGADERSVVLLLFPMVGNFIVTGLAMPYVYRPMPLADLGLMAVIAAFGLTASFLVILAYRAGEAAIVAPMQYSQILWATAYGYLLFDEAPDRATILGAGVIIASGLYIVFRETRAGASAHRPVIEARGRTETATTPKSSVLQRLFSGRGNGVS